MKEREQGSEGEGARETVVLKYLGYAVKQLLFVIEHVSETPDSMLCLTRATYLNHRLQRLQQVLAGVWELLFQCRASVHQDLQSCTGYKSG